MAVLPDMLYYPGMERRNEAAIYWNRPYGWRAGTRYIESGASALAVIRYEQEELGNKLDIPDFLLEELAQKQVSARDIVWVCRTRNHARRYGGQERGQPYKEDIGPCALILATDEEPETGYLLLSDASVLDPLVIEQYAQYRQAQRTEAQHPIFSHSSSIPRRRK